MRSHARPGPPSIHVYLQVTEGSRKGADVDGAIFLYIIWVLLMILSAVVLWVGMREAS
jgi:hypothetical protein